MGLEYRRGKPYYYRKERRGGRVVSEYIGGEPFASMARDIEDDARFERKWRRERQRKEMERIGEPVRILDGLARLAADLAREELEAAGYHRHKRGEWRKRRMNAIAELPEAAEARADRAPREAEPFDPGPPPSPPEPARRREEADARRERSPRLNLDLSSRHHLIAWVTGEADPSGIQYRTSLLEIDQVRRDLAGASPSPAEEHLAETAALCWYALRAYEIKHSQRMSWPKGYTLAEADFYQKSIERTQRRFEAALKSLALLRRIELPSLRVSVGRRPVGLGEIAR